LNIVFLEPAESELDEAVSYYNNEQPNLGVRFHLEVQKSLLRIVNYPESYQKLSARSRRCLVAKFPYGIIYQYRKEEKTILVVAIAHLHRKPKYWSSRETKST
jgi:plasmid stabilization system protein ParE